jgi:hypothetical protein
MRKLILILLLVSFKILSTQAQGTTNYTVSVNDNQLKPLGNVPVSLIETTSKERISKNTNAQGKVTFELNSGREWAVNILKMKDIKIIEVPENGKITGSYSITYNYPHWERTHRAPVDRSNLNLATVDQTRLINPQYSEKEAAVNISVLKEDKSPLTNFSIQITCYKEGKIYKGKTNTKGVATFLVPVNNEYDVDIDGLEGFNYVDVTHTGAYSLQFSYQPVTIKETELHDTITQVIPQEYSGASSRVYLKFHVSQPNEIKLGSEDVYLQMLKTNKVYKAKTDSKGEAYFLLPSKRKYMVHFRYAKDVDVLNYSDVQGIVNAEVSMAYIPDPRLQYPERYIPTPQDLLVHEFTEFLTKQFPEPKNDDAMGMTLSWGNENINAQSKEAILQIGFRAKVDKGDIYGPPLNISLVVDKSGSMEGYDRIDALKRALLNYISKLRKTDIVSLIAFDTKSTVLVPAQMVGDGSYFRDMIEDIQAGGGTDIYNGMVDGYEQVLGKFLPKGTNRVILLTDGYGITPPDEMVEKSKEYNAKGIELSAVGVGYGYNQAMLSLLATTGGGLINFVGEANKLDKVFVHELTSVLSPCAKNVTVEICYNDKIVFKQLYGFPVQKQGNNKAEMKLDNIYSGLNTLALVKFDLNKPTQETEKSPVIIRMMYYDFKKQKDVVLEEKAYLKWVPATGQFELIMEAQHKKLYAIAILNQSLKVMAEAFANQDNKAALTAIKSSMAQIKKLYPQSEDEDVQKLVTTIEGYSLALTRVMANKGVK